MSSRALLVAGVVVMGALGGAGTAIASPLDAPAPVPVYSAVTGSPFTAGSYPSSVAFSPSGRLLVGANGGDDTLSVFATSPGGVLTPVAGSPYATGTNPNSVAFSPNGGLLASVNTDDGTVSVFSVDPSGALTPAAGSPNPVGSSPTWASFSPDGTLLAVVNYDDGTVSMFSVSPSGALAEIAGSPFDVGNGPDSVAFSPNGTLLAAADSADDTVSVFSVSPDGALIEVPGSAFPTGGTPDAATFSPSGSLLAVSNYDDGTVSMFSLSPDGSLTAVPGSPFTTGTNPTWAAFSPNGGLLATSNQGDNTASVFTVSTGGGLTPITGSPIGTGNAPNSVAFSPDGSLLATADGNDGTTSVFSVGPPSAQISQPADSKTFKLRQAVTTSFSCADAPAAPGISSCTDSAHNPGPSGTLDTTIPGAHTYVVTAVSADGQTATATIHYSVLTAAGTPVAGPHSSGCPLATGRVKGATLGRVSIGMTSAQAHRRYTGSTVRHDRHGAVFCLTPEGVQVGFAPKALVAALTPAQRRNLQGRVVLALSANPYYVLRGVHAGSKLSAAVKALHPGRAIRLGANNWYMAANRGTTAVVEVRRRIVRQIGIADSRLTRTRHAQIAFIKSFS